MPQRYLLLLIALLAMYCATSTAQAQYVSILENGPRAIPFDDNWSSTPSARGVRSGDYLYFIAGVGFSNSQFPALWCTDGSLEGTYRVVGAHSNSALQFSGTTSIGPSFQSLFKGPRDSVLALASASTSGSSLYKADASGTARLVYPNSDTGPTFATWFSGSPDGSLTFTSCVTGDRAFFSTYLGNASNTRAMWTLDGESEETTLLGTFASSAILEPIRGDGNGLTYFAAAPLGTTNLEPWVTDGTVNGTRLLKDISPGTGSSTPELFFSLQGTMHFFATEPGLGKGIYRTDGTAVNTIRLSPAPSIIKGWTPVVTTSYGAFFISSTSVAGKYPVLWFNGTTTTTLPPEARVLLNSPTGTNNYDTIAAINDRLYICGETALLRLEPNGSLTTITSAIPECTVFKEPTLLPGRGTRPDLLFFGGASWQLAAFDGQSTRYLPPLSGAASGSGAGALRIMGVLDNQIIFTVQNSYGDRELYVSDGSPSGTGLLANLTYNLSGGSRISGPAITHRDADYFQFLQSSTRNFVLSKRDRLGFITAVESNTSGARRTREIARVGNRLFMYGEYNGSTTPGHLRVADSVEDEGTILLSGLQQTLSKFNVAGDLLFYQIGSSSVGMSDGTVEGTRTILQNSLYGAFTFQTRVFVTTIESPSNIRRTYEYIGGDFTEVSDFFNINRQPIVLNGRLVFSQTNGSTRLVSYDGSSFATLRVSNLPGTPEVGTSEFTAIGNKAFFVGNIIGDSIHSGQVFATDGTTEGTEFVKSIDPNNVVYPLIGTPTSIQTALGPRVFFSANTPNMGRELWVSDLTAEGTNLVKDLYPGWGGSSPANFVAFGGRLYFLATHPAYGYEWFCSDGTPQGTRIVRDIHPGPTGLRSDSSLQALNTDRGIYFNSLTFNQGWYAYCLEFTCPADFNSDGVLDLFDYLDFVSDFAAGNATADFNSDSIVDFFDYLDFVQIFSGGC